jgi:hypothetical protein
MEESWLFSILRLRLRSACGIVVFGKGGESPGDPRYAPAKLKLNPAVYVHHSTRTQAMSKKSKKKKKTKM